MEPTREHSERRGNLGRVFMKLKASLKRRRSPTQAALTPPPRSSEGQLSRIFAEAPAASQSVPSGHTRTVDTKEDELLPQQTSSITDTPLAVNAGDRTEVDDTDDLLLPIPPSRTRITEDRARALFKRHGIKYEPRSKPLEHERPNKIRRVEKPVRIRIHWTCHDCNTAFGTSKTCTACGHQRCSDCSRSPAKKVKEILAIAKQEQHQRQAEQQPTESGEQPDVANSSLAATVLDQSAGACRPESGASAQLGDETPRNDDIDVTKFQCITQVRPRAGIDVALRPKTHFVQWTCHECQAQSRSAAQLACPACAHNRCSLCSCDLTESGPRREGQPGFGYGPSTEPKMVATVQRVYRKPRQRVRRTCDICESSFIDRERCRDCGHERCKACIRTP